MLSTYWSLKKLYARELAREKNARRAPNRMLNQMRVDVTPTGFSMAVVSRNAFQILKTQEAGTYRGALQAAAKEINGNKFIQPGCSVVMTLWPDEVKILSMPVGRDHPCRTVEELDAQIQATRDPFHLDPGFAYRSVATSGNSRAEIVGLSLAGWDEIESNLPHGAYLSHYWGALSALEVLQEHFAPVFPREDLLVGMADTSRVYFFSLDVGELMGLRIVERSTLKNVQPIAECLDLFGIRGEPKVLLVSLTNEAADLRALERELSREPSMVASAAGRQDLLKAFGMLRPVAEDPQLPIALLQGGQHGRL